MFPEQGEEAILQAISLAGVDARSQDLKEAGIEISTSGKIAVGNEPRLDLSQQFELARGLMGVDVRCLF